MLFNNSFIYLLVVLYLLKKNSKFKGPTFKFLKKTRRLQTKLRVKGQTLIEFSCLGHCVSGSAYLGLLVKSNTIIIIIKIKIVLVILVGWGGVGRG